MVKRWLIGLFIIIIVFLSCGFFKANHKAFAAPEAGQSGRFQMTAYGEDFYVLDTATGKVWLFHRQTGPDKNLDILIQDSSYQVGQ
jgi:hypothetical protein